MSTWLYQFWFHGFKTAKHWGRGPRRWTADLLRFDAIHAVSPAPPPVSPRMNFEATPSQLSQAGVPQSSSLRSRTVSVPSQLCHWSIHYREEIEYDRLKSRTPTPEPNPDPLDETTWKDWPSSSEQPPCQEVLLDSLARNDFSDIKAEDLPIAVPHIVKTLEQPNDRLLEEALGFSIMARNAKILVELLFQPNNKKIAQKKLIELNPLHLSTSYLDGSKTCCSIFGSLFFMDNLRPNAQNKMGHTVFDNLMIAILKAHTSITPGTVDDALRSEKRFPGEEVDICGRWDADSDCVREILKAGDACIPFAWKHKFCHTSVQAICHCIDFIIQYSRSIEDEPILDLASGLFVKRCGSCGQKMSVKSLHTIVLTAIFLAHCGAKDEDLFGILAVLLTVLKEGANPLQTAYISIPALFPNEVSDADLTECNHQDYRPLELANLIPSKLIESWPSKTRTGWKVFCQVLRLSEQTWNSGEMPLDGKCTVYPFSHGKRGRSPNYFGETRELAVLSGAVQAEYLTYRRVAEIDPWISPNFDMDMIQESLDKGEVPKIGFFENDMVHPVCDCGNFDSETPAVPLAQDIMKDHFSNLEDWSRTTFIDPYFDFELLRERRLVHGFNAERI